MKRYEARSVQDVSAILDLVHDRFFDLDKITLDQTERLLRIPISVIDPDGQLVGKVLGLRIWRHPIRASSLLIHNAESYEVEDRAQTGQADINTMEFAADVLTITCGMPVTVKVRVSGLYLELHLGDQVLDHKTYLTWRQIAPASA